MKHIKDEEIIAYIDGKLSKDHVRALRKHILICDKCYLQYASLKSSYLEIENAKLSSVTEKVYNYAETELGISEVKNGSTKLSKRKNPVINLLDRLLNPRILVPVTAILLAVFGYITISMKDTIQKPFSPTINQEQISPEGDKQLPVDEDIQEPNNIEVIEEPESSTKKDLVRGKQKMPDFEGIPEDVIIQILENMDVKYKIHYVNEGFKQIPKAGKHLAKNDTVFIYMEKNG